MDANLFRLPTTPNYYGGGGGGGQPYSKQRASAAPTPDARFPGWAAPFSDGRLVTDYRPRCEQNVPCKAQEKTRIWIQQNSDDLIRVSRERLAKATGMSFGVDMDTTPGPAAYVKCTAAGCSSTAGRPDGVGVERVETVPVLFGTYEPTGTERQFSHVQETTRHSEGGRNTRRGGSI